MKYLLYSPWKNVWVDYIKKYFESKGDSLTWTKTIDPYEISLHNVLICGWADKNSLSVVQFPKLCDKYFCYIRSYEYYNLNPSKILLERFDKTIFVNRHIQLKMRLNNSVFIPNGIDLDRIKFKEHKHGKNILCLHDLNFKKGIPLLVQIALELKDYQFNIYGNVTDLRLKDYINQMSLHNVHLLGYETDIQKLFDSHDALLLCSPAEGNPNCVIEGMAAGLKPIIHSFTGYNMQFPEPLIFRSVKQAVDRIKDTEYNSKLYRLWIENNYDMYKVYPKLEEL